MSGQFVRRDRTELGIFLTSLQYALAPLMLMKLPHFRYPSDCRPGGSGLATVSQSSRQYTRSQPEVEGPGTLVWVAQCCSHYCS